MSASPTSAADRYGFAFNTDFSGWTAPQEDAGARRDSQRQPSGLQLDAAQLQSSTRATPVEWDRRTNSHQSGNDGSINPRNSVLQQDGVGGPGPSSSLAASRFFSGHQLGQGASLRLLGMQDDDDEEGDNEDDQDKAEGSGNSGPSTSNIGVGSLPNDSSASKAEQATKKKAGGRPRDFIWKYYEGRSPPFLVFGKGHKLRLHLRRMYAKERPVWLSTCRQDSRRQAQCNMRFLRESTRDAQGFQNAAAHHRLRKLSRRCQSAGQA